MSASRGALHAAAESRNRLLGLQWSPSRIAPRVSRRADCNTSSSRAHHPPTRRGTTYTATVVCADIFWSNCSGVTDANPIAFRACAIAKNPWTTARGWTSRRTSVGSAMHFRAAWNLTRGCRNGRHHLLILVHKRHYPRKGRVEVLRASHGHTSSSCQRTTCAKARTLARSHMGERAAPNSRGWNTTNKGTHRVESH